MIVHTQARAAYFFKNYLVQGYIKKNASIRGVASPRSSGFAWLHFDLPTFAAGPHSTVHPSTVWASKTLCEDTATAEPCSNSHKVSTTSKSDTPMCVLQCSACPQRYLFLPHDATEGGSRPPVQQMVSLRNVRGQSEKYVVMLVLSVTRTWGCTAFLLRGKRGGRSSRERRIPLLSRTAAGTGQTHWRKKVRMTGVFHPFQLWA